MKDSREWTRNDKLVVSAAVAPSLRNATASEPKRFKVYDRATGKVIGHVTWVKVADSLLTLEGIEIDVPPSRANPGVRPKALRCACGMAFIVPKRGSIPRRCSTCNTRCPNVINGRRCENRFNAALWGPRPMARRAGRPPMCKSCAYMHACGSSEGRSERSRKAMSRLSPERQSQIARMGALAARGSLTSEIRSEAARKGRAKFTAEQRTEIGRKANASLTREQLSERARKANVTRRSK